MTDLHPEDLQRISERRLLITWTDGLKQTGSFRSLRDACQCATCLDAKTKTVEQPVGMLPVLTPAQAQPLEIVAMKPVGNYAYNIEFSDGHSTGIFTFEMLRSLSTDGSAQ